MTHTFIPGTMCDERLWQRLWPLLPNDWDLTSLAIYQHQSQQDIQHYIHESIDKPTHLIGFSMGAYLAMNTALLYPDKVKSLTVIAGSAIGLNDKEIKQRTTMLKWLEAHDYNGMSTARLKQLVADINLDTEAVMQPIIDMDRSLGKDVLVQQFKLTTHRADISKQLPTLAMPVQFIGGKLDKLIPFNAFYWMSKSVPGSQYHIIENSGHMVPLEQPDALASILVNFTN